MIISRTTQCSEEITGQQKKLEHGPWQVLLISSPSYPHTHTYENLESSLLEPKLLKSYFLVFKFISKSLTKGSSLTGSKKKHTKNVVKFFFLLYFGELLLLIVVNSLSVKP